MCFALHPMDVVCKAIHDDPREKEKAYAGMYQSKYSSTFDDVLFNNLNFLNLNESISSYFQRAAINYFLIYLIYNHLRNTY